MNKRAVTEAEIIDVLLGDADPVLEAQVRQAVRHDPRVASLYVQWNRVIPAIQQSAAPFKGMNQRVRDRVMSRLGEEPLAGAQYFLGADALPGGWLGGRSWPHWLTARTAALAVATLLLAGVIGAQTWHWLTPAMVAEAVIGELQAARGEDGRLVSVRRGDRIRLPVRLVAASGSHTELRLADQSRMVIAGGDRGGAGRPPPGAPDRPGGGQLPGGPALDRRGVYRADPAGDRAGYCDGVQDFGQRNAKLGGAGQRGARAGEPGDRGQRGSQGRRTGNHRAWRRAVVEQIVQWPDLAQARAKFKTRLTRLEPAPQPSGPLKPPAGGARSFFISPAK